MTLDGQTQVKEAPTSKFGTQVMPGLFFDEYHDKQIIAYTLTVVSRDVIDKWAESAVSHLLAWPEDKPFLNLQDFSNASFFMLTSYIRKKADEITSPRPEVKGRTAVVVQRNFASQIVVMFLRALPTKGSGSRERETFFVREDALKWLEEKISQKEVKAEATPTESDAGPSA